MLSCDSSMVLREIKLCLDTGKIIWKGYGSGKLRAVDRQVRLVVRGYCSIPTNRTCGLEEKHPRVMDTVMQ